MTKAEANALKKGIIALREGAGDALASTAVSIYPKLRENGALVKAGTRINHGGRLMRAAVDLWDTRENSPDAAPALWEEINYREGHRVIPTTITAGTAFALGELGWWGDKLYESIINANVYTPEQYANGWKEVL